MISVAEASSPPMRNLHFTPRDFERVRRLIHARAGISLADSKRMREALSSIVVWLPVRQRLPMTYIGALIVSFVPEKVTWQTFDTSGAVRKMWFHTAAIRPELSASTLIVAFVVRATGVPLFAPEP